MNRFAPTPRSLSAYLGVLALLGCAAVALALPSMAMASKCGDAVLQDWFDNGRIDRVYDLQCYEDAIDAIPADLRDYANAEDVISRALAAAQVDGDGYGPGGSGSEDPDRSTGVPGEEPGRRRGDACDRLDGVLRPVLDPDSAPPARRDVARAPRRRRPRVSLATPQRRDRRPRRRRPPAVAPVPARSVTAPHAARLPGP